MSHGALYFESDPSLPQKEGDYQRAQFQEYGDPDDPGLNAPSHRFPRDIWQRLAI